MSHMILPSPTEGKTIAIQKLDAEIERLTEQLCQVKAQRNTLTISYTIPPEVLSEIFLIAQAGSKYEMYDPDQRFSELRRWLPITHVSQHWRTVASDCAELWCEIGVLPAAAISEFLVRSRGYHLSVDINRDIPTEYYNLHYSQHLLADIFAHTSRIQKLSIHNAQEIREAFPYILLKPAPKLKELTLNIRADEVNDIHFSDDTPLFRGITPQLEFLSLAGCAINLSSPLFTANLTTLMIVSFPNAHPMDWLIVLRQLPRLFTLELTDCFKDAADSLRRYTPIPEASAVVQLPNLSKLTIEGSWLESDIDFFSYITFPGKTDVHFSSGLNPRFPNSDATIKFPLQSFLRAHNKARCNLSEMGIRSIGIWKSTASSDDDDIWMGQHPSINLSFSVLGESGNLLNVDLGRLQKESFDETHLVEITSLPISSATSFTTNCDISPDVWRSISDWFPNLERIACNSGAIKQFLEALGARHADFDLFLDDILKPRGSRRRPRRRHEFEDEESDEEEGEGEPATVDDEVIDVDTTNTLLQRLQSIHICHNNRLVIEKAVVRALTTRLRSGLPVKAIHFENYARIAEEWVSLLKAQGLVEEVIWEREEDIPLPSKQNTREVSEIEDSDDLMF